MSIDKIIIATTNKGKIAEFRRIFDGLPIAIGGLADYNDIVEVQENGQSFAENARIKAIGYARQLHCYTIADDSGLQVDALDLAPGIYSARYAGVDGPQRDKANNEKLLLDLAGIDQASRGARFCCCLCLASPAGEPIIQTEGFVEGEIIDNAKGTQGFGYDPLFYLREFGKTAAELEPELKNKISHRGKASAILLAKLRDML